MKPPVTSTLIRPRFWHPWASTSRSVPSTCSKRRTSMTASCETPESTGS
jgi:hypothetical protein